jgi:hypothetical protein
MELVLVIGASTAVLALAGYAALLHARVRRAEAAERRAVERRDRFLVEAARQLETPLDRLRGELLAGPFNATRAQALVASLDELRAAVDVLARLPPHPRAKLEEVDLGELVREVLGQPPFTDGEGGPAVMLRAQPARVVGDRVRLYNGLRVLLWVVRRQARALVVTVSGEGGRARVEIDTDGARSMVEALAELPAVGYGLRTPTASPEAALALKVAGEVARAHGGRIAAAPRGTGERLLLELGSGLTPAAA